MSTLPLLAFRQVPLSKDPNYLVRGLIPRTGISVLWGPPKSGKTFWLFDLMTHVASNRDYRGRKINGGPVVYCCFEGVEGYGARIEAIKQHGPQHNSDTRLYLMPERLDVAADYQKIIEAVKESLKPDLSDLGSLIVEEERLALKAGQSLDRDRFTDNLKAQRERNCRPAAIVLDTLNRSFVGSESNDEDMAAYIRAADALRSAFSCAVIIVHHSGHDARRPRGHSSLTGAVDAQLSVKRSPDDHVIVEVEWMRDGPEGQRVVSRLKPVQVGTDTAGDPITSCVVMPDDVPATAAVSAAKIKLAIEALDACVDPDGSAPVAVWRDEMKRRGVIKRNGGNPRSAYKKIKDRLVETHQISVEDDVVRRLEWQGVSLSPFLEKGEHGDATPKRSQSLTGTDGDSTGTGQISTGTGPRNAQKRRSLTTAASLHVINGLGDAA